MKVRYYGFFGATCRGHLVSIQLQLGHLAAPEPADEPDAETSKRETGQKITCPKCGLPMLFQRDLSLLLVVLHRLSTMSSHVFLSAELIARQFLVWLVLILNWQVCMIFWLKNHQFSQPNNVFSVYNYRIDWYCLGGSLF